MFRTSLPTSFTNRAAASEFALLRSSRARYGGFQNANHFSPEGEPSSSIASAFTPVSLCINSAGFPMVAEHAMSCGTEP